MNGNICSPLRDSVKARCHRRADSIDESFSGFGDGRPSSGQLLVPDVECGHDVLGWSWIPGGLFQKGVALTKDAIQLAACRIMPWMKGDQQVVQIIPAALRSSLDESEVVGSEHADLQCPQQVTGAPKWLPIYLNPPATNRLDLRLD